MQTPSSAPARLAGSGVLIVGGSSGIAVQLAHDVLDQGAAVTLAGRDLARTRSVAARIGPAVRPVLIDLADETSIAAAAADLAGIEHVVSLAAAHANGPVAELERDRIASAFDAKVIGPLLLAKHVAPLMPGHGALVLFSGVAAWRPSPGLSVMATTNGAVAFLVEALAVELAPVRVVGVSPGVVDSGAWDGPDKQAFFDETARTNPARRVGAPADLSAAVLFALTSPFVTGTTLHVDGGGRLA